MAPDGPLDLPLRAQVILPNTNILIPQWKIAIMNDFNDKFVEFQVKLRQKLSAMGISLE